MMEFTDLFLLVAGVVCVYILFRPGRSTSKPSAATKRRQRSNQRKRTASSKKRSRQRSRRRDVRSTDPKDTPVYLEHQGWEQVSTSPERYVGRFRANGTAVSGGLERTKSGRRKFLVHDPPRALKRAAHGGRCLTARTDLGPDTYEVHFNRAPASFGDGIDAITALMKNDNA